MIEQPLIAAQVERLVRRLRGAIVDAIILAGLWLAQ